MAGEPILVVDDNPINVKLLSFVLESAGFEVRTAEDAPDALRQLASWRPRLIVMDLQLPGIDGLVLTRQLKAAPETRGIVILAVTAYAMAADELRALEAGCDGYLAKPIDTRAFPEVVAAMLSTPRA